MCFMCDNPAGKIVAGGYSNLVTRGAHVGAETALLPPDYVGDAPKPKQFTPLLLTTDAVGDDPESAGTATVGGAPIVSTIDSVGDKDLYKIYLESGRVYDINLFLQDGGPSGVGLQDPFLVLRDASGQGLATADGGGTGNLAGDNSVFSVRVEESGFYYISAQAYDQDSTNGQDGDGVGDYRLWVTDQSNNTDPLHYKAYYDVDSPLLALEWGSVKARSSRNPDGESGPRDNGAAHQPSANQYGIEGKNVFTYYLAKQGDVFTSSDPTTIGITTDIVQAQNMTDWEKAAYREAFNQYENVADVVYIEVQDRNLSDFTIVTYPGTPGVGASLLGRASPPGEESEGQMEFNSGDARYTEAGLARGGFFFTTLLHEFGHAHGLAHPHDNGGRSSTMRGGTGATGGLGGAYGAFGLSQGVFTIMSYNDGWVSPWGQPRSGGITGTQVDHFGWVASLSPLDIGIIQDKYGVNEEYKTGDDTYTLKDVNAPGTFYESIWDGSGTDQIVYDGTRDANIDLRAASLKYEEGGGGRVSYAFGIHGGYTIANGVVVENARTGAGNDKLTGNDAANKLIGGAGNDTVDGGAGDDAIYGGAGKDVLSGGAGQDQFLYADVSESGVGLGRDVITDFVKGEDRLALNQIGAKGFIGSTAFTGTAGEVNYHKGDGVTVVRVDVNGDRQTDIEVELAGLFDLDASDFIDLAAGMNDRLVGTAGADLLQGGDGNDTMVGAGGNDTLDGGNGSDTADYSANTGNFTVDLNIAGAQNTGSTGYDTLIAIENLIGGRGANKFYGNDADNRLEGGAGTDLLYAGGGHDVIVGGTGRDLIKGGAGSDLFIFDSTAESAAGSERDVIFDFAADTDQLDLSRIDANIFNPGDDEFNFIGNSNFTRAAGELRYYSSSTGTVLAGDTNGDGVADFEIGFQNKLVPSAGDILL